MEWLKDVSILQDADVSYLDEVLLKEKGGFMKMLPASFYEGINRNDLMIWANKSGRYGFPTVELIEWLKAMIGDRMAIEVGAGHGDLGHHLGVIQTDSYMQTRPEIQAYYVALGQSPIVPPEEVFQYDAVDAVKGLKPKVVIASWLTQLVVPEECETGTQGSVYGADEVEIIKSVDCYIHIGNDNSHSKKKALELPHTKHYFPWLVSRGKDPSKNVIYVWGE